MNLKFENKHFSFSVDTDNGNVLEIINLYNGENIIAEEKNPEFIYLRDLEDNKISPVSLEETNGAIKATFENGVMLDVAFEIFDDFMTFEILSDLDANIVKSVTFVNLSTYLKDSDDGYLLNGMGMTAWVKPCDWGYRCPAASIFAEAFPHLGNGVKGAKMGIVFSKKEDAIEILKKVADAIDPKVGLTSRSGGPYSREWEANYGDYALILSLNPENLEDSLKYSKEFDLDQYDIHQSVNETFVQGDFRFAYTESGTAEEFSETLGKKIKDTGMATALHTYAYYISPMAHSILTNPKWQKQIEVTETFTLASDIDESADILPTLEDASGFDTTFPYGRRNTNHILIDEEIIKVKSKNTDGLCECERGACGTKAVPHKKDSIIKHLDGMFVMFAPVLGSELFYHIADLTAKAYNEGGFDMIYMDAIDGIHIHLPVGQKHYSWYYHQMFVQRVLSQCNHTPIVETSAGCPQEWNFRGRGGAWDFARFSIKKQIGNHVKSNLVVINRNMTATLGWFCFFVDEYAWGGMKNTIFKTVFRDDMDFLGMNALIYDMSIVFHPLDVVSIKNNPFHYANIKYYTEHYTKLRKSHYFSTDTLERVKAVGGEWRVVPTGDEFKFQQIHYHKENLGDSYTHPNFKISASNPFKTQTPFVRIESRFSTLFNEPVILAEFDETKPIGEKKIQSPTTMRDISSRMAMSIKVKGTGRDGDAALISLSGGITLERGGRGDHFIDLNFEGWREFILIDMDNGEYDYNKYAFDEIATTSAAASTFRYCPSYEKIDQVVIRVTGDTAENACFGNLISYPQAPAPIKNPTVKVGDSEMTFNCSLHGGDYIEYDPETDKALLYRNMDQVVEEVTYSGKISVPNGDFTATYSAECESDAPLRAKLVFGFTGEELNK